MSLSLLSRAARLTAGSLAAATGASSAATLYVYQTDESWRRLLDFHVALTPMMWEYYRNANQPMDDLHEKYAPLALQYVLDLGGYYVKCAQMFCGMNLLPSSAKSNQL